MDRSQELTEKLSEILAKFGEEHGVVVSISSVSFSTPEVIRNFAYVKNGEAVIFGEKARRYGMGEEDYGKRVMVSNKVMRLVDCFPNRHKYPFVVEDGKGKRWKVTAETAKKPAV
jgi:hypothetical protein